MRIVRDLVIVLVLVVVAVFLLNYARSFNKEGQTHTEDSADEVDIEEVTVLATGVSGQVVVGPLCPVSGLDVECPNPIHPYVGVVDVVVNDPERELIARVRTDDTGTFATTLPAGEYVLVVQTDPREFPICQEEVASVVEGSVTKVFIDCDSGIR